MLKAVVFDLDGVIVDSEPIHYQAFLEVARERGAQFDYETYLQRYVGYDDRDGFAAILADTGVTLPASDTQQLIHNWCLKKGEVFASIVARGLQPMPGVLALIEQIADSMPLAIATGASREDAHLILSGMNLQHRFNPIITAADVVHSKPDPQTYSLAVDQLAQRHRHLRLRPENCLAIEDTTAGIASARAAGLQTLAVASTSPAHVLQKAHRVVPSLENVSPDHLHRWFG